MNTALASGDARMHASPGSAAPRRVDAFAVAVIVVAIAAAALQYLWVPQGRPLAGGFSDSVDYLVLADYFRGQFDASVHTYSRTYFGISRFPPLYPLTLAAAGAGIASPQPAYWLTYVQAIAALLFVALWLRRENERAGPAAAFSVALALCPGLLLLQTNPISEPLLTALLFGAMLLAARAAGHGRWLAFAMVVSIVPLARMSGIALIAAAIAWSLLGLRLRGGTALAAASVMLLPTAAWVGYRRLLPIETDYLDQLGLAQILGELGGWSGLLLGQWQRLWRGYIELFDPGVGWLGAAVGSAVLALAVLGWWQRLRHAKLDALFLPLYLGLVFVWPFPAEIPRLLSVTLPIVLQSALDGAMRLRMRSLPSTQRAAILASLLVVAGAPSLFQFWRRMLIDLDPVLAAHARTPSFLTYPSEQRARQWLEIRARMAAAIRALPGEVPRSECVYSALPAFVWFVAQGQVNVKPVPMRLDPARPAREQFAACRYFLVAQVTSPQHGQPGMYPLDHIREWTRPVFVSMIRLDADRQAPAVALLEATETAAKGQRAR